MAEQSSTVTMFRALVMLICLALIPFAAIGSTSFPAVVKAIQSGRLPTLADFRAGNASPQKGLSEAPRFEPARSSSVTASATSGSGGDLQVRPSSAAAVPSVQPFLGGTQRGSLGDSAVVAASYNTPAATERGPISGQSTGFPQNAVSQSNRSGDPSNHGPSALSATTNGPAPSAPEDAYPRNEAASQRLSTGMSQPPRQEQTAPDGLFKQVQDRLKQLGATYYLLEAWGDHSDEFRFYCRMAIGGNRHVTKSFEQVDADPLNAMTRVLQQVEEWQKSGSAPPNTLTTGSRADLR